MITKAMKAMKPMIYPMQFMVLFYPLATTSRTTKGGKMTDTERLDFIAQRKLDVRYSDLVDEFIIASYTKPHEQYFHWARNADLRTAIDEAMKEMRGLNNATTN
ncbi:hypothetical protein P2I36_14290 [Mannheimia haemolytica]|nr:hypothetical protein [Mannheimia haemolytica]